MTGSFESQCESVSGGQGVLSAPVEADDPAECTTKTSIRLTEWGSVLGTLGTLVLTWEQAGCSPQKLN